LSYQQIIRLRFEFQDLDSRRVIDLRKKTIDSAVLRCYGRFFREFDDSPWAILVPGYVNIIKEEKGFNLAFPDFKSVK